MKKKLFKKKDCHIRIRFRLKAGFRALLFKNVSLCLSPVIKKYKNVFYAKTIARAIEYSDLIIIHTEWNDFKSINFNKLINKKKTKIFDMRNIYSLYKMKKSGIKYFGIGK